MQPKSFEMLEILRKYVIMYSIPKRMVILMKIDVITYRDKLYDNMLNGHTVIVIDVLRCTSAIIAALDNGAAKIIPAVEPGDATAYANRIGIKDCILGGAPSFGLPITLYDAKCNAAKAYISLAEELIECDNE